MCTKDNDVKYQYASCIEAIDMLATDIVSSDMDFVIQWPKESNLEWGLFSENSYPLNT